MCHRRDGKYSKKRREQKLSHVALRRMLLKRVAAMGLVNAEGAWRAEGLCRYRLWGRRSKEMQFANLWAQQYRSSK